MNLIAYYVMNAHDMISPRRFFCNLLYIYHNYYTQLVDEVTALYSKALNASKEINGAVKELRYIEQTTNKNEGSRFLLEMDVQLYSPREEIAHTSEYVYLEKGTSNLCHTSNFQWTRNVDVHFVVSGMS